MVSVEDLVAKKEFIQAFFDDLEKRIQFTDTLFAEEHRDEARLLCCVYIEALGNGLEGNTLGGAATFTKVLELYGGEPLLSLIHPKALRESLPYKNASPNDRSTLQRAVNQ